MPSTVPSTAALKRLQRTLEANATEKSRQWWERYLKGSAAFRGVPMGEVRKAMHAWWESEGFDQRSVADQKAIALRLFEEEPTEDRLAGVLAFAERLMPELGEADLPAFARLFERGHIADWNLCDWFCVKVLGPMVSAADDPPSMARAIGAWKTGGPLWQRRAAAVAFVNLAKHGDAEVPGLVAVILGSCEALVADPERFAQTGVGWVLRELSVAEPEQVIAFAERHSDQLSREAMKSLAQKLPERDRRRLLAR